MYFVNEAITNGIKAYNDKMDKGIEPLSYYFEYKIIDLLTHIYRKIDITNPYQLNSEKDLVNNLMVYGLDHDNVQKLINLLSAFNLWEKSNHEEKNDLLERIFRILAKMVIAKKRSVGLSSEEEIYYNDFFSLKDPKLLRLANMSALNIDDILSVYDEELIKYQKEDITEEIPMLKSDLYEKYNVNKDVVKSLPNENLLDLNKDILDKEKNKKEEKEETYKKPKTLQMVITSGNGFIDGLVLLSIMCTEIMVGIIITVLLARL